MPKFRCCFTVEADTLEDLAEDYTNYEVDPNWEDLSVEEIVEREGNVIPFNVSLE
jgi:hypothetical protein